MPSTRFFKVHDASHNLRFSKATLSPGIRFEAGDLNQMAAWARDVAEYHLEVLQEAAQPTSALSPEWKGYLLDGWQRAASLHHLLSSPYEMVHGRCGTDSERASARVLSTYAEPTHSLSILGSYTQRQFTSARLRAHTRTVVQDLQAPRRRSARGGGARGRGQRGGRGAGRSGGARYVDGSGSDSEGDAAPALRRGRRRGAGSS